jgi:hypothetical protein
MRPLPTPERRHIGNHEIFVTVGVAVMIETMHKNGFRHCLYSVPMIVDAMVERTERCIDVMFDGKEKRKSMR